MCSHKQKKKDVFKQLQKTKFPKNILEKMYQNKVSM